MKKEKIIIINIKIIKLLKQEFQEIQIKENHLFIKNIKMNLPSGMSIKTEGLCIKYPELNEYKDRKIILLDSTGL